MLGGCNLIEMTASVPGEKEEVQKCNSWSDLTVVDLTETFFLPKREMELELDLAGKEQFCGNWHTNGKNKGGRGMSHFSVFYFVLDLVQLPSNCHLKKKKKIAERNSC